MAGASIETTLELWASSLRDVKQRMRPLFSQDRVATSAGQFLDGLLGNEPRKTGWMRAEAAGDAGPWRQQAILGWAAGAGMLTPFVNWCGTMRWKLWQTMTRFW
jgi:SRSO17 transposase